MEWKIRITDEAKKDYRKLDGAIRKQVLAGIYKVSQAPLPSPNGYGKPLGNKNGNNLTGFFKIKYRGIGIRIVYTLVLEAVTMNIVVISERDDNYCYDFTSDLYKKYGDEIFKDIFEENKETSNKLSISNVWETHLVPHGVNTPRGTGWAKLCQL